MRLSARARVDSCNDEILFELKSHSGHYAIQKLKILIQQIVGEPLRWRGQEVMAPVMAIRTDVNMSLIGNC